VGDLLLGRGSTTWLGEYPGCVEDYLTSLRRVRAAGARVLYPSHGPPILFPDPALDRFENHRRRRLAQLQEALEADPSAGVEDLLGRIYGATLGEELAGAARASVEVMLHHIRCESLES
jgi:glyoxylase-like metal-dependent hydrolase (beta-lactamase superfamily II)